MDRRQAVYRRRKKFFIILCVWLILGVIGFFSLLYFLWEITEAALGQGDRKESAGGFQELPLLSEGELYPEDARFSRNVLSLTDAEREYCRELYEANKDYLVLVNKDYELENTVYVNALRSICNRRLEANEWMYDDLTDMLAAAGRAGYSYWIASAYRSRERQQELVDEDVEACMAKGMSYEQALEETYKETMPAGKSEHETGLALDILCTGNMKMDASQALEPGNVWLVEHAHEYGFILRYPEDKEDITKISYEPWHFRYVGAEAAAFLWEKDMTLEEFHECLLISGEK